MTWLEHRMVVVSNRLPVTIEQSNGGSRLEFSSGGLVTALRLLLNDCSGVWIGWTGTDASPEIEALLEDHSQKSNLHSGQFLLPRMRDLVFIADFLMRFYGPCFMTCSCAAISIRHIGIPT